MSLARKSILGTAYVVSSNMVQYFVMLLLGIFLSRAIDPLFFGVYAAGELYYAFIERFNLLGFDEALRVSKGDLKRTGEMHRFLALFCGLFSLLVAVLAKVFCDRYGYFTEGETWCLVFVALMKLVELYIGTTRLLMEKEFHYARISRIMVYVSPVSGCIQVYCAYVWGFTFEAIALGTLFATVARFLFYIRANPFGRVAPIFHKDLFPFFIRFGPAWLQYLTAWGSLLAMRFDSLCVKHLSPYSLDTQYDPMTQFAFYGRAFEWANKPTMMITHNIGVTALSVYAKLSDELDKYRQAFSNFMGINLRFSCLAAGGLFLSCQEGIPLMWGPNWGGMVPIMQWMVVYCAIRPTYDLTGGALIGLGEQQYNNKITLLQAILVFIGAPLGVLWKGAIGAAIATSVAILISSICTNTRLHQRLGHNWFRVFIPPFLFMALGIVAAYFGVEAYRDEVIATAGRWLPVPARWAGERELFSLVAVKGLLFLLIYGGLTMAFEGKRILRTVRKGVSSVRDDDGEA